MSIMKILKNGEIKGLLKILGVKDDFKAYVDAIKGYKFSGDVQKLDIIVRSLIKFFPMINDMFDQETLDSLLIGLEFGIDSDPVQKKKLQDFLNIVLPIILAAEEDHINDFQIK